MGDSGRWVEWQDRWEDPIWESCEQVYESAELSTAEVEALDQYHEVTGYYLLRAKIPQVTGLGGVSQLREAAGLLRFLNGGCVSGLNGGPAPRQSFVKEMFRDRPVHKAVSTRPRKRPDSGQVVEGRGIRISARSNAFFDKLAELRVLALLCANGHLVEFPPRNAEGPQPEFFTTVDGGPVGVEVKNLDVDSVLDRIFGGIDETEALPERDVSTIPGNYEAIVGMIKRQYEAAASKFEAGPVGIVVVFVPIERALLEPHIDALLKDIRTSLATVKKRVGLVVLTMNGTVELIANPNHVTTLAQLELNTVGWDQIRNIYSVCEALNLWPSREA